MTFHSRAPRLNEVIPMDSTPKTDPLRNVQVGHTFEQQMRELNEVLLVSSVRQHELTEQAEKANAVLCDGERHTNEFLAMLGHELRNPLAAILNGVHLLRLQGAKNDAQQKVHSIIERQLGHLVHLVDDLLEVSRISTGQIHLRRGQVDLRSIAASSEEAVHLLVEQRRHTLAINLGPSPILIDGDSTRLAQVVVNLLNNAAKYTDDGGQIWLSVGQEENEAVLRVRDTGIGIAAELMPHIFKLFIQAERSLARSQGGMGIGLSLVQRLVELHGGKVTASSVLGQGSEFVVRLPLTPTPNPLPPPPPTESDNSTAK